MTEHRYRHLNKTVLKHISSALDYDPAADLETVLGKLYKSYAHLRQSIALRQAKLQAESAQEVPSSPPKQSRILVPDAMLGLASSIQWQPTPNKPHLPLPGSKFLSCSLPYSVVFPLSPLVCKILGITEGHPVSGHDPSTAVVGCVLSGVLIWEGPARAVVQIAENVVVKVAQDLDQDEHGVLRFLEERVPAINAPRALGFIKVGFTSFMFMTVIPGTTLENRWPSLSTEAKEHIRSVLDTNLIALRKVDYSPGEPFGSPVGLHISKDTRRYERVSKTAIYSESQFNDFLLDSPRSRAAPGYKNWLRSMLRVDHRIVFSHADFHPRNIMVVDGPDGVVELSGILDWEASGFYPEYWELLKAMNTRSVRDTSDWWDHLPPSILGYDAELVLDRVIEATAL